MQKWYVEDYLTHKCVKNSGEKPQYFVEDDHDPIVPKAVFYQVQGEKKRRSGLMSDPSKLRFGNRLALNGRFICGKSVGACKFGFAEAPPSDPVRLTHRERT